MDTIFCKEFFGETLKSDVPENGYCSSGNVACLDDGPE